MTIFQRKLVKQEPAIVPPPAPSPPPAVPAKPIDTDLTNLISPPAPKKTREGRLSASQWRAAFEHWKAERSFTATAQRFGVSTSAVSKRASKDRWIEKLGQDVVVERAESRLEVEARVAAQLDRLGAQDRVALIEAVRQEHVRIGAELIEMARDALVKLGVERTADAIALYRLGLTTQSEAIGKDESDGATKLGALLADRLRQFAVKPKVKVEVTTNGGKTDAPSS